MNGEKVGDNVLTPAVSQFNKRSMVITYDITGLVKEGRNDIILWLGHGWYSKGLPGVDYDRPLVRAQAEQLNNGNWETIVVPIQPGQAGTAGIPASAHGGQATMAEKRLMPLCFFRILQHHHLMQLHGVLYL